MAYQPSPAAGDSAQSVGYGEKIDTRKMFTLESSRLLNLILALHEYTNVATEYFQMHLADCQNSHPIRSYSKFGGGACKPPPRPQRDISVYLFIC